MLPTARKTPTSPRLSFLFGFFLAAFLATCTDAPPFGENGEGGQGNLGIAAQFSFGALTSQGQNDALNAAFDEVDRFRVLVTRTSNGSLALDTVILVVSGQDRYDLDLDVPLREPGEFFTVSLTALDGNVVLFEAQPFQVQASPPGSSGSTPVAVTLLYRGPGFDAVSVTLDPQQLLVAPGGTAQLTAIVTDASGGTLSGVPLAWENGTLSVGTVSGTGTFTAASSGITRVSVSTPTGLEAGAWVYVVSGEVAYVEDGHVHVGSILEGGGEDRTPSASGASFPTWTQDGTTLFYQDGESVFETGTTAPLLAGGAPAVSPDGLKLAVEAGGAVVFSNDDGTFPTEGPAGATPQWTMSGEDLIVGGGSIEKVRADGTERSTLVSATGAHLPAISHPNGGLAYLMDTDGDGRSGLVVAGSLGESSTTVIPESVGVRARPSWSSSEEWLLVGASDGGILLVHSSGSAPAVAVPALVGASEAAWRPSGGLFPPPTLFLTSISPEEPGPGEAVEISGGGFDWIIPENNQVLFPGPEGSVPGEVTEVGEDLMKVTVPDVVTAGSLRVVNRDREASLAFSPAPGKLVITVKKPPEKGMEGIVVTLSLEGSGLRTGTTDSSGQIVFEDLEEGEYEVSVTVPTGFTVDGANPRTVLLVAGASASESFLLNPDLWMVRLVPEVPDVPVGEVTELEIGLFDAMGDPISPVGRTISSTSMSSEFTASGSGPVVEAQGVFPCDTEGCALLRVNVDGTLSELPLTVTSRISGLLYDIASAPWPGLQVSLAREGASTIYTIGEADGTYLFEGLLGGSYTVTPTPPVGYMSVPASKFLPLGAGSPTGVADFQILEEAAIYDGDYVIDGPAALATLVALGPVEITGSLTIEGSTLTNLDGLETLQKIGVDLIFQNDLSSLANVSGLSGLQEVGGTVRGLNVFSGLNLTLPALTKVGHFYFHDSSFSAMSFPVLSQVLDHFELINNNITGPVVVASDASFSATFGVYLLGNSGSFTFSVPGLTDPGPKLELKDNPGLSSFSATTGATGVTTSVDIDIWNNAALTSISLPNMVEIMEMELYDNPLLQTVSFPLLQRLTSSSMHVVTNGTSGTPLTLNFPVLQSVGTNLEVGGAGGDIGALSFPALTTIPENLWIVNTTGLTSVSFPNLTSAGFGEIRNNQDLTTFDVSALYSVATDLEIRDNPVLLDFDAGSMVLAGAFDVFITGNPLLTTFDLSSFQNGAISIVNSDGLVSLPSLPSLGPTSTVYLDSNPSLTNVDGLAGVTDLYGFTAYVLPSLTDVSTGLANLQRANAINIDDADLLESIALPALTQLSTDLNVYNAPSLTSLSAPLLGTLGSVRLDNVAALNSLTLSSLATFDDDLLVRNTGLTSLAGFSSVTSTLQNVVVRNNANLLDVSALGGIGNAATSDPLVLGNFIFQDNTNLCGSFVDDLIVLLEAKFLGSAFAVVPVNTGNATCAGPSPARGGVSGVEVRPDLRLRQPRERELPKP